MKLLSGILICFIIQLFSIISGNPIRTTTPKENFLEFYDQELYLIGENFCEKAKNLSDKLLQDKDLQEASTPHLKEFKKFLENFQQDYPHFKRYKLYQPLLALLINVANTETINKFDRDYENILKFKETAKQYFANLLREYEQNYEKFIKEKFLTKTEDLKKHLTEEELKQMPKFNELIEKLQNCHEYHCFPTYLDIIYSSMNLSQELVVKYAKIDLIKAVALIAMRINDYGLAMLNDEQFSQLTVATRENLLHDVNDFNTKFSKSTNMETFVQLIMEKPYFPKKYEDNENIPLEDRPILKEMLKKLKSSSTLDKYEAENANVMQNLTFKIVYTFWLIPEDEIRPYYEFLGIPYKKSM